jgi:DNA-binding transcriptional MocR family regulator
LPIQAFIKDSSSLRKLQIGGRKSSTEKVSYLDDVKNKTSSMVDLKFNYPSLAGESMHIKNWMATHPDASQWLRFPPVAGSDSTRSLAKKWMNIDTDISDLVLANSGNHAITIILETLDPAKGIITDPYTYPAFKHTSALKNILLHAAPSDHEGLTLKGIEEAYARTRANVLYLQPTIHNPTCTVMSLARRQSIADFVKANDMMIFEDDAYRFLHPSPPPSFLELLPSHTIHVNSLSKPFNPLLKTAFVALPHKYVDKITNCIRLSSSGNSSMMNAFAEYVITNGIVDDLIARKRTHAHELQQRMMPTLEGLTIQTHPHSFHLWIRLKEGVSSTKLSASLGEKGILIPTGPDFETAPTGEGEQYLRVALAAERDETVLSHALQQLRQSFIS